MEQRFLRGMKTSQVSVTDMISSLYPSSSMEKMAWTEQERQKMIHRVVLIGFSGAGKSSVGKALAESMDWQLIDTDSVIEQRQGRTIPEIFSQSGEREFRAMEQIELRAALKTTKSVIATGGGAVIGEEPWSDEALGNSGTLTAFLDAPAETLHQHLMEQQAGDPSGAERPMLAGSNPLGRIKELKASRERWYRRADVVIPVDGRSIDEIVGTVVAAARTGFTKTIDLDVPGGTSAIRVGDGVAAELGDVISARWPMARRVWVVADEGIADLHLDNVAQFASESGKDVRTIVFPSGESSKSVTGLSHLYDNLLSDGIERSDIVIALGGGVAGDLVGFAAATILRGVGLVQVPTTLLAMVDSSVGGKTGINHSTGKNLIGAFYQPVEVLIDPVFLQTLPDREYRSGWAEIIKHSLIERSTPAGDSGLFELVRENAGHLASRTSPLLPVVIARNVEIKASVVQTDEREAGLRAILNFGHTIGHAVEAAGYRLLHGEAISVGLCGAMHLGVLTQRVSERDATVVSELLARFGLPTTVQADKTTIRRLMTSDKKRVAGEQRWVLPLEHGAVEIVRGVPDELVSAALDAVIVKQDE